MVTKNPQIVHRKYFWTILVTFIFDVKLDINICKPCYVNLLFFVNVLYSPEIWLFWHLSTWHFFDNLTSFWQFDIFLTFWHLFRWFKNHLIAWHVGISFQQFGTLPIGIFLSNLGSRHLMTSPRTILSQFWHMSIFGDSRALWVICQRKMPSENQFFLDEGAMGHQSVLELVGGQVPRLNGGTIFGGVRHT